MVSCGKRGSLPVADGANIVAANHPPAAATASDDIQSEADFMGIPPCVFVCTEC
jgi:hypothetical protein